MGSVRGYDKLPLSIADQANLLKERGLLFTDLSRVQHYLAHIGYYRLKAYCLPFEQLNIYRNHMFQINTTFDQVLSLYMFDQQLRLLVMEALECIEIAIRTHWANGLAMKHKSSHPHIEATHFNCPWQHASDIARMANDLKVSKETFIVHYRDKYKEPFLPPIWAVVETLSFGALSRWFKAIKCNEVKQVVAKSLGMPNNDVLEQVLHALTPVRNVCAHHCRLWNRRFTLRLPIIKRLTEPMMLDPFCEQKQPSCLLYNYLLVMEHLMQHINPDSDWPTRLGKHIQNASTLQQQAMGFPADWEKLAIWQ